MITFVLAAAVLLGALCVAVALDGATTEAPPAARLLGWDCIEFWVGNARAFTGFLMSAFGFSCTAYAGPETGVRDKASYVLEQGDIRLVISGALTADSPIAAHVQAHGDGVHDLAWLVTENLSRTHSYRAPIHWWIFGLIGAAAIMIALLTVGILAARAAMANPVKTLRTE